MEKFNSNFLVLTFYVSSAFIFLTTLINNTVKSAVKDSINIDTKTRDINY